jgi:hypothetical protein
MARELKTAHILGNDVQRVVRAQELYPFYRGQTDSFAHGDMLQIKKKHG